MINAIVLSMAFTVGAAALLAGGYFFIFWDRRSDDSPSKEDGQVGLKLAIYMFLIVCVGIAASGVDGLLGYLLSGAKATMLLKLSLGSIIAGAGLFVGIFFLFLPRTNTKDFTKAERYAVGLVAVLAGLVTIISFQSVLQALFGGAKWKQVTAFFLAHTVTYGALTFLSLMRLGSLSGWTAPVKMPAMPAGFAQPGQPGQPAPGQPQAAPQQGYPPQQSQPQAPQQGYPPQGGQVPPAGGGYPPQGGGNLPPPGGGYPPQGGGFPQQ
jgi:hypothetical protein